MAIIYRLVKGTALTHAELDNNFRELVDQIAAVASPVSPTGVSFSTAPGAPTVTNTGITETASVVDNNGTPVNIPSLLMPYSLAAAGKKRRDAIVVDYLAGSPTYVRIPGTEVASTDVISTPSIPANRLFVRYLDISDGAATAYQSELGAKLSTTGGTMTGVLGISKTAAGDNPHISLYNPDVAATEKRAEVLLAADGDFEVRNVAAGKVVVKNSSNSADNFSIDDSGNATFRGTATANGKELADKDLSINTQTASYTLALTDRGSMVRMNVASANTLTVPPNSAVAFPVGTQIVLVQAGAGQTTIVAGSGVTINASGAKMKLTGQYSGATLIQVAANQWTLMGDLSA